MHTERLLSLLGEEATHAIAVKRGGNPCSWFGAEAGVGQDASKICTFQDNDNEGDT